jgi:hypothetical protein
MGAYDLLTGFSYFMCATSDRHPTNHTPHALALALARSSALSLSLSLARARTHTQALGGHWDTWSIVLRKWGQVMRWLLESRNIALSRWWQQPHSVTNKGYLYHPHVIISLQKAEIESSYRSVDHLIFFFFSGKKTRTFFVCDRDNEQWFCFVG